MSDYNLTACLQRLRGVFIFAADIVQTDESAYEGIGWRSGRGLEADKSGPVFSYERVLAAAALHRMRPELIMVPSGGVTNVANMGRSPPIARVISFELQKLEVPAKNIIEEPYAFTTWDQIVYCSQLACNLNWGDEECAILAPLWQMPRVQAMLKVGQLDHEIFSHEDIVYIGMERALAAEDPAWNEKLAKLYEDPDFRTKTLAAEALGAGQLLTGHQPRWPNPFRGFRDPLE